MLREYIYLDRKRVEDFLSQLEGGISDTTRQSETSTGAEIKGSINVGLAKIGSSIAAPSISQEELRRTTDIALFERLYGHIAGKELVSVSRPDEIKWSAVHQGDLLELDGTAAISGFTKVSKLVGSLQALAPLMGQSLEGIEGFGAFFGEDIGCRYMLDGTSVAFSNLLTDSLRTDLQDIEGDCKALVRVRRVFEQGKEYPLQSIAGMKLGVPQLEEMLSGFAPEKMPAELGFTLVREDLIGQGPSALVTTVAIYR